MFCMQKTASAFAAGILVSLVALLAAITAVVLLTGNVSLKEPGSTRADAGGRGYTREEYLKARETLLFQDDRRALGAGLILSSKEKRLDAILLKEKRELMERARRDRLQYIPALSFFMSKSWMENTTAFKIIRKMPKGAALHLHEPAIASLDWLVKNATYREDVFMCNGTDGFPHFNVFRKAPENPDCPWRRLATDRDKQIDKAANDEKLRVGLSMMATDPLVSYPSVDSVWDRFNTYFDQVIPLIFHVPILRDYYRQALQEFWEDNVQYLEMRGAMFGYTDYNITYNASQGVNLFKTVTDDFVQDHPDFFGAGVIMSGLRFESRGEIKDQVKTAMSLMKEFPDFFLGYDLVGQEGPNQALLFYLDALLYPTMGKPLNNSLPYFFHAAETKWQGMDVDENLADALLLNTTRIGHGYSLAKHPQLADEVKRRDIAVEVNPISNQLLGLVSDLRNHPMIPLIAEGFPVVISSDDPAVWEAYPLTHDFFVAFMDMSGRDTGLTFLKQLAINSIKYSALSSSNKEKLMEQWRTKWDKFINEALEEFEI